MEPDPPAVARPSATNTGRSDTSWLAGVLDSPWAIVVLAVLGFVISIVVQHHVYPGLSWNRDEPVYLWQVDLLRAGQLSAPDGGHPELFQPWLSAARDGALFSQYTVGWPAVLALGALLGSTDLAVAAGTALAVVGTWVLVREMVGDRLVATVAAAAMVLSPILAVQGGLHLNYLFTLGLGLLFVSALSAGVRRASRTLLVGAGLLLGSVFITRPYDALVWGLLGCVPVLLLHRRHLRRLVPMAGWTTVGLAPLVVLTLLLNVRLTGHATEFPITVADPLDQYGFGTRRLMPTFAVVRYGPTLAASSTGRNAFWLPVFLLGAHLGAIVAAWGAWVTRRDRGTRWLLALGLAFPLAYFPFFGTHISSLTARLSGPIYYLPSYAALCALLALGLVELARRRPRAAVVVVVLLVVVTVPVSLSRLAVNRGLSKANEPWAESLESLQGPALIVPSPPAYLLYLNPYSDNGATLGDPIMFASDGPTLFSLLDEHPNRPAYLQRADASPLDLRPSEHPVTPTVELTPMHVLGEDVHLVGTVSPVAGAPTSAWWVELDGRVIVPYSTIGGEEDVDLTLEALSLPEGIHTLEVKVGAGDTPTDAATSPRARRTFYVRVTDGSVALIAPGTAARYVTRDHDSPAEWEPTLTVAELAIEAVEGGAG